MNPSPKDKGVDQQITIEDALFEQGLAALLALDLKREEQLETLREALVLRSKRFAKAQLENKMPFTTNDHRMDGWLLEQPKLDASISSIALIGVDKQGRIFRFAYSYDPHAMGGGPQVYPQGARQVKLDNYVTIKRVYELLPR